MGEKFGTILNPELEVYVVSDRAVSIVEIVKHASRDRTYPFPSLVSIDYSHGPPGPGENSMIRENTFGGSVETGYNYRISIVDTTFSIQKDDCLYYVRVNLSDGNQAWSSPMWIEYGPSTKDEEDD
jgi:hypothetical protein